MRLMLILLPIHGDLQEAMRKQANMSLCTSVELRFTCIV